jgi:hypothetical protein
MVVSVSGGETSMYMAWWLTQNAPRYYKLHFIFANTGEERTETLDFIHRCEEEWRLNIVWLEAKVHKGKKGTTYNVVDYDTAARDGEPFEEVIKKYGIPNHSYPHCTRELKLAPIQAYMKKHHLTDAWTAIGIRSDEIDRQRTASVDAKLLYPFIEWAKVTKKEVKEFWAKQSFNLGLKEHEGNCRWCWKKSDRKVFTLMQDRPDDFNFPEDMEAIYGLAGHNVDGTKRVFFRKNRSTADMREQTAKTDFTPFVDENFIFNPELDMGGSCSQSCEVYLDED